MSILMSMMIFSVHIQYNRTLSFCRIYLKMAIFARSLTSHHISSFFFQFFNIFSLSFWFYLFNFPLKKLTVIIILYLHLFRLLSSFLFDVYKPLSSDFLDFIWYFYRLLHSLHCLRVNIFFVNKFSFYLFLLFWLCFLAIITYVLCKCIHMYNIVIIMISLITNLLTSILIQYTHIYLYETNTMIIKN